MSDTNIVMDHLRAALLATPKESTFLTYLIQMALIEGGNVSKDRFANQNMTLDNGAEGGCAAYAMQSDKTYAAPSYA